MHVAIERNSWRLPQDDVVQVVNAKSKIKNIPDELAYAGLSDGQYWKSVILALLVISLVIAGIAGAIITYGFVDELLYWSGKNLRLDDILNTTTLFPHHLPSMWISSTAFVYQNNDGDLSLYNTTTNNVTVLMSNYTLNQINVKEYQCSYDLNYILLKNNINQVFKNTFTAHVTVYTIKNGRQTELVLNEGDLMGTEMQSAEWAGRTNNIIFVKNNDIYVKYETDSKEVRITYDGVAGVIYNGIPDWLYQEEIFLSSKKAFWSTTDGSLLLYASFNDSQVTNLKLPWIEDGLFQQDLFEDSTTMKSVRYPVPGSEIPQVKLWLVNITYSQPENRTPIAIQTPISFHGQDYYLTSAQWVNDRNTRFSVSWMSRVHNSTLISYYESPSWKCKENHVEIAPPNMWLEIQHPPAFSEDGQSYLLLGPVQESGLHYFTQIKHVTVRDKHIRIVTYGRYDVLQILAWDTANHIIYYLGMDEGNTGKQHLYAVNDQTTEETMTPETRCITCDLKHFYQNCSYFNAYFSTIISNKGVENYVIECEERPLPIAGVHDAQNNSLLKILFDENDKIEHIRQFAMPKSIFESIPLPKGYTARIQLMMPPSWRPELRDAAFPVIIQVDGRPNSQLVTRKWQMNWGLFMSARKGIVYMKLDVRGSKGQSTSDLYRLLGDIEVKDKISVIKSLLATHKYLDKGRIGVWGWGYGGYVATMLMNSQYNVFKCGIAVSPITDWRYYNVAFTEKILGLKSLSNEGYMRSDLRTKINFIASNSFYIIQGLADISVPYQHGIKLADALTRSATLFQHQVYANEGYELKNVLNHMYRSMENHFSQCLALEDDLSNHL